LTTDNQWLIRLGVVLGVVFPNFHVNYLQFS